MAKWAVAGGFAIVAGGLAGAVFGNDAPGSSQQTPGSASMHADARASGDGLHREAATATGREGPEWLDAPAAPKAAAPLPSVPEKTSATWPMLARVRARAVPVSHSASAYRYHVGALRLGALVRVRPASDAPQLGCSGGWLDLEPHGIVCPDDQLELSKTPPPAGPVLPPPDPTNVIPHRYVKVTSREAFRWDEPLSQAALEDALEGDREVIEEHGGRPLDGAYFLAVEKAVKKNGYTWLKTHEGNYVRAAVTEPITPPTLVGARLEDPDALPLAFVIEPQTPAVEEDSGEVIGYAERYARVPLSGDGRPNADGMVSTEDGYLLPADNVRVVRRLPRPTGIPEDARWLQINHARQTLLAFEGDVPRYATLVSSGKPGRATPSGVHRVQYKHLTTTMRGADPSGPYEVQEVPWVLYYDGPYAVHGAYWHDGFGETRSHGCTNLAPADARHVFRFMRPKLPAGWHTESEEGSYVHMTRDS